MWFLDIYTASFVVILTFKLLTCGGAELCKSESVFIKRSEQCKVKAACTIQINGNNLASS